MIAPLVFWIVCSVADLVATSLVFQAAGGPQYEANPLARRLMEAFGLPGWWALKIVGTAVVAGIYATSRDISPLLMDATMGLLAGLVALAAGTNVAALMIGGDSL